MPPARPPGAPRQPPAAGAGQPAALTNPAVAARVRQLAAQAEHRRAIAEFRARHAADQQARINALLLEAISRARQPARRAAAGHSPAAASAAPAHPHRPPRPPARHRASPDPGQRPGRPRTRRLGPAHPALAHQPGHQHGPDNRLVDHPHPGQNSKPGITALTGPRPEVHARALPDPPISMTRKARR